jgi:hypothetical protein
MIPNRRVKAPEAQRLPDYWLRLLDRAIAAGELEEVARAVGELREVGIDLSSYFRPRARLCGQGGNLLVFC